MKCFTFSTVIFLILFGLSSSSDSDLIVETLYGPVRGTILTSARSNRPFFGFMGIPYAKPPVGDLRFKPLQPLEPWTEVRNATAEGPICPQKNKWKVNAEGVEDCLFINIYTPKLPSGPSDTLLPVLFLIHGGGFLFGSGNQVALGPDFMMDENVVVVSFNYRLGIFGFLSLQNSKVPGNNGLKDQTFALRWTKQNIARFGGDPSKITIAGSSAGGAAVHYQVLSPMSRGLFQRAIVESSSALYPWGFQLPNENIELAFHVGKILGTNTTDKDELLRYLMGVPMEEFRKVTANIDRLFLPTTEINTTDEEVFLPDTPINILKAGNFNKVSYLTGVTSREGIMDTRPLKEELLLGDAQNKTESIVMNEFGMEESDPRVPEAAVKLRQFYFGGSTNPTLLQLINLDSEVEFTRNVYCTIKLQAAKSTSPIYVYQFSFIGYMNIYKDKFGGSDIPGAAHADELAYLYNSTFSNKTFLPGTPEMDVSRRIVRLWANFVKTGNPTPEADPLLQDITWPPLTQREFPYLDIDTNLTLKHNLLNNIMNFWDQLTRNYTTHSLCG
ncbi:juvenile hormone esterase-like [Periplaneta americana]|uniref:juvenile hormone esterase-like n=1 Tax=Periplaneta americana TaxID=6978 RepID=UPI0037E80F21